MGKKTVNTSKDIIIDNIDTGFQSQKNFIYRKLWLRSNDISIEKKLSWSSLDLAYAV